MVMVATTNLVFFGIGKVKLAGKFDWMIHVQLREACPELSGSRFKSGGNGARIKVPSFLVEEFEGLRVNCF